MSKVYAVVVGLAMMIALMFVVMVHYTFLTEQAHASGTHASVLSKAAAVPALKNQKAMVADEANVPFAVTLDTKHKKTAYTNVNQDDDYAARVFEMQKYTD